MSTKREDMQFYEWLFGRGEYPFGNDKVLVPYPFNFHPIRVEYIPQEEIIEVEVR